MYIAGEYGGMNEVLARLYEITGDERLLTASRMFDNTVFFNGLAENKDTIQTRHANQHIPQIVGAIHEYAATGDPYYYNVARNFWEMATARYAYSIGGVGTGESFKQPYRQGNNITGSSSRGENCETCAAYNMLKLTRDIYVYDPDNAEYMDYYERTVLNQIAASQSHNTTNSMHNGCTYMLPIDPGQRKTYDSDYGGFTCCNGTGMENHVIYQIAAYAKTDDTIYVNLFMPSTAEWEEKGITLRQETKFPSEDSRLTVSGDVDVEGFSGGQMRIETASGDVKLEGAELSGELWVGAASGDVNGENLRCCAAILQTASGDLGIELLSCDRAELKTASGDLELERVICAGPLTAVTASGDLRLAGCDAHGATLRTVSGDVDAEFLRQMRYETHTVTGDVSLPAGGADPDADLCSIHTVSGDICATVQ